MALSIYSHYMVNDRFERLAPALVSMFYLNKICGISCFIELNVKQKHLTHVAISAVNRLVFLWIMFIKTQFFSRKLFLSWYRSILDTKTSSLPYSPVIGCFTATWSFDLLLIDENN